jgi:hypothetical protein
LRFVALLDVVENTAARAQHSLACLEAMRRKYTRRVRR